MSSPIGVSGDSAFARRAARADALADASPAAEEVLRFAAGLFRVQGRLAAILETGHVERALCGRLTEDGDRLVDVAGELFRFAAAHGPPLLAPEGAARSREDRALARTRLIVFWEGGRDSREDYLSRAALQPYWRVLAGLRISPDRPHRAGLCPFCAGAPWIAVRRSEASSDGAQRLLGCALCGGEWRVNRIRCPRCGEEDPSRLPCFQSEACPAARVEACETCRAYLKSIDLTVDARAIPEVDDLLSLAMDLWATGQGFTRIEPGLAGV